VAVVAVIGWQDMYIDRFGNPLTPLEWALMRVRGEHIIAQDRVKGRRGDACVSTVFLGFDHAFGYDPPLLYETMVFLFVPERPNDVLGFLDPVEQIRATTGDEAHAFHQDLVEAWG
jgi:hypothetical protein